ncbi:hypothetical protein ACOME3_009641 [Neoechinorhynchus agilis]
MELFRKDLPADDNRLPKTIAVIYTEMYDTIMNPMVFLQSATCIYKYFQALKADKIMYYAVTDEIKSLATVFGTNVVTSGSTSVTFLSYKDTLKGLIRIQPGLKNPCNGLSESRTDIIRTLFELNFPDRPQPQLALVIGHTMTTSGFDPLLIPFTEFRLIKSSAFVCSATIRNAVRSYCGVQQNYGK